MKTLRVPLFGGIDSNCIKTLTGHKPRLITDIYGQKLIDFVSEHCVATLKDMQIFLAEGLKASQFAISQFLMANLLHKAYQKCDK